VKDYNIRTVAIFAFLGSLRLHLAAKRNFPAVWEICIMRYLYSI